MQMERERQIANGNNNYSQFCNDYDENEVHQLVDYNNHGNYANGNGTSSNVLALSLSPPSSPPLSMSPGVVGFIEHPVSKLDTLAGVAIKYGVEVGDIKRMNGLVTDLQMFALKSLQIPLPGRHPPSPCLSNSSDNPGESRSELIPPRRKLSDLFESFQSLRLKPSQQKVSQAMSSLQGYYGLKQTDPETVSEGFEMALYRKGDRLYQEDGLYLKPWPPSNRPLSHHRKSKSLVNGFLDDSTGRLADMVVGEAREGDSEKWNEKLVRRRQKSEADFTCHSHEMLMRDDNNSRTVISAITGKGLALRPKAASRACLPSDSEAGVLTPVPIGTGDTVEGEGFSGVRKSSSTSSLHDQDGNGSNSSSIWQWSLKPDLQVFSAAAIARPIFDGLPKPITGRRNKAALD